MATRFEMNAVVSGRYESNGAFEQARTDVRGLRDELNDLNNEVTIRARFADDQATQDVREFGKSIRDLSNETVTVRARFADDAASQEMRQFANTIRELNGETITIGARFANNAATREVRNFKNEAQEGVNLEVNVQTDEGRRELERFKRFAKSNDFDVNVDIDINSGRAVAEMVALRGAAAATGAAFGGMEAGAGALGERIRALAGDFVFGARLLTASGFYAQLLAITAALYAVPVATRAVGGAVGIIGSTFTSAGIGAGLLAAAGYRLWQAMEDGQKYTRDLSDELDKLKAQFTGQDSVFDNAARELAPLATRLARLANEAMPALGKEAEEVAREFSAAFGTIADEMGGNGRNSLNRILENASDVLRELTEGLGLFGGGLINIFGNEDVIAGARDFAEYVSDIGRGFQRWTESERGRESIAQWVEDAQEIFSALADAVGSVADGFGAWNDEDVTNVARAIRGIGNAAEFVIEQLPAAVDLVKDLADAMFGDNAEQSIGRENSPAYKVGVSIGNAISEGLMDWATGSAPQGTAGSPSRDQPGGGGGGGGSSSGPIREFVKNMFDEGLAQDIGRGLREAMKDVDWGMVWQGMNFEAPKMTNVGAQFWKWLKGELRDDKGASGITWGDLLEGLTDTKGLSGLVRRMLVGLGNAIKVEGKGLLDRAADNLRDGFVNALTDRKGLSAIWMGFGDAFDRVRDNLNRWVNTTSRDIGRWINETARDFGRWARDVPRDIGRALSDAARAVGRWVSGTAKDFGRWVSETARDFGRWAADIVRTIGRWASNTARDIGRWISNTARDFARWISNNLRDFGKWASDLLRAFGKWASDSARAFGKWIADTARAFGKWIADNLRAFGKWASDWLKALGEWASDTISDIKDWAADSFKVFTDWLGDWIERIGNWGIVDAFQDKFGDALSAMRNWIGDMQGELNDFLASIGIGSGAGGNAEERKQGRSGLGPGSPAAAPRPKYEGGIYGGSGVRYMASGGMIDADGMYTAMATGMDRALSRGAVWQAAIGGISDGMVPRVVYGEGRPGAGPKKEAYIPEDMDRGKAIETISEAARWHGLEVSKSGSGRHDSGRMNAHDIGGQASHHAAPIPPNGRWVKKFATAGAGWPQMADGGLIEYMREGGILGDEEDLVKEMKRHAPNVAFARANGRLVPIPKNRRGHGRSEPGSLEERYLGREWATAPGDGGTGGGPPNNGWNVGGGGPIGYTADGSAASLANSGAGAWPSGWVTQGGGPVQVAMTDLGGALRGLSYSSGKMLLDVAAQVTAATHEFGHMLNLGHGGSGIMGGGGAINDADLAAVAEYRGLSIGGAGAGGGRTGGGGLNQSGGGRGIIQNQTGSGAQQQFNSQGGGGSSGGGADAWQINRDAWGRVPRMGRGGVRFMQSGGIYPVSSGNVDSLTWDYASQIASKYSYLNEPGTTYAGHGADGNPGNSVDFQVSPWGTVAAGSQFETGQNITNTLSGLSEIDYLIWNKQANYGGGWEPYVGGGGYPAPSDPSGYHQDHVHMETGGAGVSGGPGGGPSGMDPTAVVAGFLASLAKPNFGVLARYGGKLEPPAYSNTKDRMEPILIDLLSSVGYSGSGGGGSYEAGKNLDEWARNGLIYGNTFDPSDANIEKIKTLAMKESGGDPNAQNPSGASGLMQMMPETFAAYAVAAADEIMNPVHNVGASSRYQKDRYGDLVTFSPYSMGGIATREQLATLGEHGPEMVIPLSDPEAARRFISFMEEAAVQRSRRGPAGGDRSLFNRDDEMPMSPRRAVTTAAVVGEIKALRQDVADGLDIKPTSQQGIGVAAASGTIQKVVTDEGTKRKVADSQDGFVRVRNSLTGRRGVS